jgi:hypothetical protein
MMKSEEISMSDDSYTGAPGTINQKPRWQGPAENRPRGYLPAEDEAEGGVDAAGEDLADRSKLSDGLPKADTQARSGAGPALAAHSKDASSSGASGQSKTAAGKRPVVKE